MMKRVFWAALIVLAVLRLGTAQDMAYSLSGPALPTACRTGNVFWLQSGTTVTPYYCNAGTWAEWSTGSGGSAAWGGVTGTLANQTDLQTALDAKAAKSANLSDLTNAGTARTNLGLGTAATTASTDYATAAQGTDARTPTAHAASHLSNGSDPMAGASTTVRGTVELATDGESAASLVPQANDARLSNARTPTAHAISHVTGGSDVIASAVASGNAGLMTGTDKTKLDGVAAGAEVNVNADWNAGSGDAQILNKPSTFAPSAHATSHKSGGADSIALDTLAAPTDITTLNASTTAHGLLPKLSNVATQFLNGTGAWTVPAGGGGGATKLIVTADRQNTTVNFADVTDLTLALSATTRYIFECTLVSTTAVSTTATQIAVNGPTQTSLRYTVETATSATATHRAVQTAYDTNTNPATGAAAVSLPIYLHGQVLTNGAGTFAVRFRSEIAASAVNILAGSYCFVQ